MKTRCNATAVQLAAVLVLLRSVSSLSLYFDVWCCKVRVCGPDKQKQITSPSFCSSNDGRRFQSSGWEHNVHMILHGAQKQEHHHQLWLTLHCTGLLWSLLGVHLDEFDSLVWQLLMWLLMQVAEWIRSDFSNLVKGQRVWMQLGRCWCCNSWYFCRSLTLQRHQYGSLIPMTQVWPKSLNG